MAQERELTHLDEHGAARMVDIAAKPVTHRRAVASARVLMEGSTLELIAGGKVPKGDVFAVARVAGIMAAKRTSELIPMCHPLALTHVSVDFELEYSAVKITATAETDGKTGIEMEALTAAAVAGLTIYDMCKAVDRAMVVTDVLLVEKAGGASGHYLREDS
ncbi:MAG TPA: cyclic pyranopterin monophosphate synthase MoaC [Coriobacteriia bacterium]|nr:cyclic pyranopterin monophosphate synthase MoaC [Coriobacteriia bacterium]